MFSLRPPPPRALESRFVQMPWIQKGKVVWNQRCPGSHLAAPSGLAKPNCELTPQTQRTSARKGNLIINDGFNYCDSIPCDGSFATHVTRTSASRPLWHPRTDP